MPIMLSLSPNCKFVNNLDLYDILINNTCHIKMKENEIYDIVVENMECQANGLKG
ncbi:hypothetical protein GCM10008906_22880 [Clostridium oceanicum]|uniref:Uncharacterized protein n=1 Tax=Clostridium oceanicum TaxID=1543 RepID=A0ABN1JKA6_9CLOT